MIPRAALSDVVGAPIAVADEIEGPRASGRLESHYAPATALTLVDGDELADEIVRRARDGERVIVLAIRASAGDEAQWLRMPERPDRYAQQLYAALRRADAADCDRIIVERPPAGEEWTAVLDRLGRAAA
jgi:L-threonylcarbamoyladenylate synthase